MADKSIRIRLGMEGGKVVESELVSIGNKGSAALGKVTAATTGAGAGMGRMGGAVQNASYQISDMIVQAEMGTDVFRIMGQQLPQLLAGFGVFGAVVGVAAAAMGPLIRMLSDGSDPVKALTEDLKALDQALSALRDADKSAGAGVGDLVEKYGSGAEQAQKLLEILRQLAEARANMAFNDAASSASDVFGGGFSDFSTDELETFAARLTEVRVQQSQLMQEEAAFGQITTQHQADAYEALMARIDANSLFLAQNATYVKSLRDIAVQFGISEQAAAQLAVAAAKVREADNSEEQIAAMSALSQLVHDVSFGMAASKEETIALSEKLNKAVLMALEFSHIKMSSPIAGAVAETNLLISRLMMAKSINDSRAGYADRAKGAYQLYADTRTAANTPTWAVAPPKVSSGGSRGGGGASDIDRTQKEVERLNETLLAGASPAAKYRAELAKLDDMKLKGLTDGAYAAGVAKLNAELANASPWKKFTDAAIDAGAAGENVFEALIKTAKASLVNIAKEIVNAQLGRLLANSLSGGGGGGLGALLRLGSGGGGGGLGALLGGGGGGLGSLFTGSATGGFGLPAFGAGFGAIAGPLAIAALLPSIIGGTKDTDSGYRGTVTTGGIDLTKYTDKHTSRLFGLINNRWTEESAAESGVVDPLRKTVNDVQANILQMAEKLEVGADAFDGFAYKIDLSVKGLSESEALAKLQGELAGMGDAFASMITGVKSAQELSAVYGERLDLDRAYYAAVKDEVSLQKMQFDATHALNRARAQEVFDAQKAAEIADERAGLEDKLLNLRGDQDALDRKYLDAIDPKNRALAEEILAMERASEASAKLSAELGRLSENDFADRLSFDRARGDMVSGLRAVATVSVSPSPASAASAAPLAASVANDLLSRIETNISMLVQMQKRWELDGLPTVSA